MVDEAAVALADGQGRNAGGDEFPMISAEPSFLYSSRSLWYPQAVVSDYATARIRLTVPAALEAVGSGELEPGFPVLLPAKDPAQSRVWAVMLAEPVPDHQTTRLLRAVAEIGISVNSLFVNRVLVQEKTQ